MKTYQVHDLKSLSMSDAYDCTQCCDEIKDGDILIVQDGAAVLVEAWPMMVSGESSIFHKPSPDFHAQTKLKYQTQFDAIESKLEELEAQAQPVDFVSFGDSFEY
jgi:hypothetical protein